MNTLAPGMDPGIGPSGTHNANLRAKRYGESFFERRLNRHELGLARLVLLLPTVEGAAQIFATETVAHQLPDSSASLIMDSTWSWGTLSCEAIVDAG